MSKYTVDALSLSHIGDLLRDRLGDNASQYLFPDDFEKAVVDIGFAGLVIDGDSNPYDEIIFIGNVADKMLRPSGGPTSGVMATKKYKKATFIGSTVIPSGLFINQSDLEDVVFCDGITSIETQGFYSCSALTKNIILPESLTRIAEKAFGISGITGINGSGVTSLPSATSNNGGQFYACHNLKTVSFPKVTSVNGSTAVRGVFLNCDALETVQIGSVDYPVSFISTYAFQGCTSAFTITIYTTENYVDTLVTNIRGTCANATIVIKAAADTTYNGTAYSAGDTIKTSTP